MTLTSRHLRFNLIFLFIASVWLSSVSAALDQEPAGLTDEIMLHPLDGFTAYTLKKNEFIYNQSPLTLPLPSWAWWGITDSITAEIDLLPLVGGFLQEPYLPVPSFNFRFKLQDGEIGGRPALAYETMVQYLYTEQEQADTDHLLIRRKGASWYNRLNASFQLRRDFHIHLSSGVTYAHDILVTNRNRSQLKIRHRKGQISPDASISFDYRVSPGLSLHATASYGTTFVYWDNIPRKYQLAYGFRIAPFLRSKHAFFRNSRAEFTAIQAYFADADERDGIWIPILPYVYWQWGG
ncbi:MAG: hypothetical protein AB7G93_19755 [Bdellovibrionales bacterium]